MHIETHWHSYVFFSKIWNARLDELWHLSLCPRYHRSCSAMPNHERCHFCVCVHICTPSLPPSLPPFETNPPNVKADVGWQLHSSAEGSNSIMDAVSNVGVWVDKIYMGEKRRREGEEVGGGRWYHWNTAGVIERGMGGMISYRRQGGCFRVSVFSCWWPACPSIYFLHKLSVITPTAQHDDACKENPKAAPAVSLQLSSITFMSCCDICHPSTQVKGHGQNTSNDSRWRHTYMIHIRAHTQTRMAKPSLTVNCNKRGYRRTLTTPGMYKLTVSD